VYGGKNWKKIGTFFFGDGLKSREMDSREGEQENEGARRCARV